MVIIYEKDASGAFKETVRKLPDTTLYHGLGGDVLLWGDNLFTVAIYFNYLRVYRRDSYSWKVRKDITFYDITDMSEGVGTSMAAWDTDLFVGAITHTCLGSPPRSGSVYVFRRDLGGPENWGLLQEILAYTPNGYFGHSLAAWGDSRGTRVMIAGGGAVYMYTKAACSLLNTVCFSAQINCSIRSNGTPLFTWLVLTICAHFLDWSGTAAVAGYYQLEQKIRSPDRTAGIGPGALLGDLAVLCAPSLSWGPYTNAGGCWLFERKSEGGTTAWVPTVSFRSAEPQTGALFGGRVALSSEAACANMTGKNSAGLSNDLTLLISAYNQTVNGVEMAGKVFVFRYTAEADPPCWVQITPTGSVPAPRYAHTASLVAATNRMYVFGGMGTSAAYNDMYSFDLHPNANCIKVPCTSLREVQVGLSKESLQPPPCLTHSWTALGPASRPPARSGHTMALDNTTAGAHLWVFGGYDPASAAVRSDLWRYDIAANTWTQIVPTLLPLGGGRVYAASICMGSALYFFGGITSGTSEILAETLMLFDTSPPALPRPVTAVLMSLMPDVLFGGATETMAFHTHQLVGDNPHPRWNTVFVPQAVPASAIDSTSATTATSCPCNGGPETCSCWRGVLFGGEGYWTGTGYPGPPCRTAPSSTTSGRSSWAELSASPDLGRGQGHHNMRCICANDLWLG
ncbi:hypothetical protein PAPYR_9316 [Paratrimastix pyriformis]|uniref:Kelch repeat protein n=1 Tax=Paratrimastix pyriformis TaxID=342808 RepID=A0ABQ8U8N7_9EUKA|nr:hypothetical protein PAPYR_9316 [Paratrimastix pyriformis]